MANAYTNPFIHNIGLNEKNSLSHLLDHISPEIDNETTPIEHSKYYNDVEFKSALQNTNSKISILSLNYYYTERFIKNQQKYAKTNTVIYKCMEK